MQKKTRGYNIVAQTIPGTSGVCAEHCCRRAGHGLNYVLMARITAVAIPADPVPPRPTAVPAQVSVSCEYPPPPPPSSSPSLPTHTVYAIFSYIIYIYYLFFFFLFIFISFTVKNVSRAISAAAV